MNGKNDSSLIGSKIVIKTDDGVYEGLVRSVVGEMSKVSLYNVKVLPEGKPIAGLLIFYGREIRNFKILESKHKIEREKINPIKKIKLPPIPFGEIENADEMMEINDLKNQKLFFKKGKLWIVMGLNGEESSNSLDLELDKPTCSFKLPDSYEIINAIDDDFKNAIRVISNESAIGVHIEGAKMGREGEVCLLNISTRNCIYLFDIYEIGELAFTSGLKNILQDESITKIFNNCRLFSDILFHHYKITLKNISDTQVLDIIQRRYHHPKHKLPENIRSLFTLCRELLDLDDESITFNQDHNNRMLNDVMSWQIRPLPHNHRVCAISRVVYLIHLQKALMARLLLDVTKANEIYLGLVRDAHNPHLAIEMANYSIVPQVIGNIFGEELQFKDQCFKPINPTNDIGIFDKMDLYKDVMSSDKAIDLCMKQIKISDFKEGSSDDDEGEHDKMKNLKLLNGLRRQNHSETRAKENCDKNGAGFKSSTVSKKNHIIKEINLIPAGMESNPY